MRIKESEAREKIFRNTHYIWPFAAIFFSWIIFSGDAWPTIIIFLGLMSAYLKQKWDLRILLGYGIGMMVLGALWAANDIAVWGYWLFFSGVVGLTIDVLRERA